MSSWALQMPRCPLPCHKLCGSTVLCNLHGPENPSRPHRSSNQPSYHVMCPWNQFCCWRAVEPEDICVQLIQNHLAQNNFYQFFVQTFPSPPLSLALSLSLSLTLPQARLTCPCCNSRVKDAVLTKCFHVFCFECVKTRYDTRQRKCPKCNAAFGANDFHRIYIGWSCVSTRILAWKKFSVIRRRAEAAGSATHHCAHMSALNTCLLCSCVFRIPSAWYLLTVAASPGRSDALNDFISFSFLLTLTEFSFSYPWSTTSLYVFRYWCKKKVENDSVCLSRILSAVRVCVCVWEQTRIQREKSPVKMERSLSVVGVYILCSYVSFF